MIKTYDEALKTLDDIRTYLFINRADECVEELDKFARYFINEKHKENPTLDECIKEWENKNAQIKMNHKHFLTIYIPHNEIDKYIIVITFYKTAKQYDTYIYDTEENNVYPVDISFELHDLIHKTVKALENYNETK